LPVLHRLQDGRSTFFELVDSKFFIADELNLFFIEHSGSFFPVSGDERNGIPFVEHIQHRSHLMAGNSGNPGNRINYIHAANILMMGKGSLEKQFPIFAQTSISYALFTAAHLYVAHVLVG
jgi:hypothetical protein